MNEIKTPLYFYMLGGFVAKFILEGNLHADIKSDNFGVNINTKDFSFFDSADTNIISIPHDLDQTTIQKLATSLIPLIADIPNNFLFRSFFRAGFVSYGGILGHHIFLMLANNKFTSSIYTGKILSSPVLSYDPCPFLSSDSSHNAITEWKQFLLLDIDKLSLSSLEYYEQSPVRKAISDDNKYYLDKFFLISSYIRFYCIDNRIEPIAILNLANIALQNRYIFIAYGLYLKCKILAPNHSAIQSHCKTSINRITRTFNIPIKTKMIIHDCLQYDVIELLWVLDEIEYLK